VFYRRRQTSWHYAHATEKNANVRSASENPYTLESCLSVAHDEVVVDCQTSVRNTDHFIVRTSASGQTADAGNTTWQGTQADVIFLGGRQRTR